MGLVEVKEQRVSKKEVEITLGDPTQSIRQDFYEAPDDFAKSGEDLRLMKGLSPATKRKNTNTLQKARQGSDGKAKSKQVEVETITGYLLFDVILPPYNLEYLAKLYHASEPHAAAVNAKVSNIVGLGYQFVESPKMKLKMDDADDEETKTKLVKKIQRARVAMEETFEELNEEDTFQETLKKVWTDYEATGNGYIEIGRTSRGDIGYVGHIPSTSLRVRKQRDGFVQIVSDKVIFFRNFGSKTADPLGSDPRPNEVIHIKKYSPVSSFYGVPDIIAAQQAVAGNEFAARFNLDYFENKAVPRYVIVSKGADLSATAQRRLTEFFETGLKGKNHRTIYVPLPAEEEGQKISFEMQPVEAGTQDSSFTNYHKANVDLILMAHRVPITKVSAGDGIALAAARDLDKTFKEQVCRPEQTIFEKKINRVVRELTDMFLLKLNELSLTDEDTQSQIDERDVRNSIVVPNEIRTRRGMPAIPDGNTTAHEKEMEAQTQAESVQVDLAEKAAKAQKAAAAAAPKPVGTTAAPKKSAQRKASAKATAGQTRTRDAARSAGGTDSKGEGRNAKGDGRKTP
jgi:PBSX family phage portal protein